MDIGGKRRSEKFEDRGHGGGGGGGGGGVASTLMGVAMRRFGIKGALVVGVLAGGVYLLAPDSVRSALLGGRAGSGRADGAAGAKVCDASKKNAEACDFSRVVLASTEDVWTAKFSAGSMPRYDGRSPKSYELPTLVIFAGSVSTNGCGSATSAVGPFYCPADNKLYIDPSFYDTLAARLKAPGDFAQAFVIAHEVGHHVQNMIGSLRLRPSGETKEQASVRAELQADCFSGVWGHSARADLKITDEDLSEAIQAAHAIGDDALGHSDESKYTHGSSDQRIRWFRRGFDNGDPRKCDTFAVEDYDKL